MGRVPFHPGEAVAYPVERAVAVVDALGLKVRVEGHEIQEAAYEVFVMSVDPVRLHKHGMCWGICRLGTIRFVEWVMRGHFGVGRRLVVVGWSGSRMVVVGLRHWSDECLA